MNDLVKELVLKAGGDFWQRLENDVVKKDAYITFDPPEKLEKLIEMVVNECAEVAGCNGHVSGFTLADLIKQHFKATK